jgi:hypothetical protein
MTGVTVPLRSTRTSSECAFASFRDEGLRAVGGYGDLRDGIREVGRDAVEHRGFRPRDLEPAQVEGGAGDPAWARVVEIPRREDATELAPSTSTRCAPVSSA